MRRSSAVELAHQLRAEGADVVAFDPAIEQWPDELSCRNRSGGECRKRLRGGGPAVIVTAWPELHHLAWPAPPFHHACSDRDRCQLVPGDALRNLPGLAYTAVGLPWTAG